MEVIIAVDDLHPEPGWGCQNDIQTAYLENLWEEFGCKFTLFVPSNYHGKWPISKHKDWIKFWKSKDWIELAAHGHFHACDRTDMGECEFLELDTNQKVETRIGMCLKEWEKVNHKPAGWRNPGWVAHPEAIKVISKYFDYAAIHEKHNHDMSWDCKTFIGCDGINETDIKLYDNTIMFQSHISGDWNNNVWNKENYLQLKSSLKYLIDNFDINFMTLGEKSNIKNVIYIIKSGNVEYSEHTIPLIYKYAKKVSADVIMFDDKKFKQTNYPSSNFMAFDTWKHFQSSHYEKMMYIDIDIRILDNAPNIFDHVDKFGMAEDWKSDSWRKEALQEWFNLYFAGTICKNYFNGGVLVSDKDSIKKLNNLVPEDIVGFWRNNPDGILHSQNQGMINYFIAKSGIDYQVLEPKWNKCCRNNATNKDYFIHYVANKSQIETNFDSFMGNKYNSNIKMTLESLKMM